MKSNDYLVDKAREVKSQWARVRDARHRVLDEHDERGMEDFEREWQEMDRLMSLLPTSRPDAMLMAARESRK